MLGSFDVGFSMYNIDCRGFSRQLGLDIVYVDNSRQTKKTFFVDLSP